MTRPVAEDAPLDVSRGGPRESLLFAAVAHLFAGGVFLVIGPTLFAEVPKDFLPRVMTWALIPTLFVGSLILTARRNPRGSIGAALVAAFAWIAVTFLIDPTFALRWLPVQAILLAALHYALFRTFRPA